MARTETPLTDTKCEAAKAKEKDFTLLDGQGLSRSDRAEPDLREDAQVVADVADKRAGVVVAQIGRLEELGEMAGRLRQSLKETDIDADNQAEFARTLNVAVDAELKLIKAERQAYGIDELNSEESYEDRLARLLVDL